MPTTMTKDEVEEEEEDDFRVINSVRSGENLIAMTSSIRSVNSVGWGGGKFDSVRSYQHEFEMDADEMNGDDDDDSDVERADYVDDQTELTYSPNSKGYNNKSKEGDDDDDNQIVLAFCYRRWKSMLLIATLFCIIMLIGWTFFTAEYEVVKKEKKGNNKKRSPHRYEYQKEEIHSCEKDGCGLSAQAEGHDDRHHNKNVTPHLLPNNNNTEIEPDDHCGWGNKKEYMEGDSAIHFTARKNVGKGCTYCKNHDKCVYKHPLYAVCLSDSQCMSNKCDHEQLCAK